jgi:hypothetical protein
VFGGVVAADSGNANASTGEEREYEMVEGVATHIGSIHLNVNPPPAPCSKSNWPDSAFVTLLPPMVTWSK